MVSKKGKKQDCGQYEDARSYAPVFRSFAHPLCLGTLSFGEGKTEYPTDLKRNLVYFSFASYFLAYCLAEGASPAADEAEGGGGVATLIASSARPNPASNTVVIFT